MELLLWHAELPVGLLLVPLMCRISRLARYSSSSLPKSLLNQWCLCSLTMVRSSSKIVNYWQMKESYQMREIIHSTWLFLGTVTLKKKMERKTQNSSRSQLFHSSLFQNVYVQISVHAHECLQMLNPNKAS